MKCLIERERLIVLIRQMPFEKFVKCVEALHRAGVKLIEVCFDPKNLSDHADTERKIRYVAETYPDLAVGAGTVLTPEQADIAYSAGAKFILSPVTDIAVIRRVKELGMLAIPGAYTPNECWQAVNAGADYIKLFPITEADIPYFTVIQTPLPKIGFILSGGVNAGNAEKFLSAGATALSTGASILKKELVDHACYEEIYRLAGEHVNACKVKKENAEESA